MLYADATHPFFRRRGVQAALIAARLRAGAERGCDLATAGTLPGTVSQRNYERLGFQVAYTRALMVREWPQSHTG
jgi:GNAT superfamily N-acetyltransferase